MKAGRRPGEVTGKGIDNEYYSLNIHIKAG